MMNQNTFENFCDKYKIIYSIEPYDRERNVIKIPQKTIYSNCIICIGNCLMAEDLLNKPISDGMINYLTTFSGNNITINNIILSNLYLLISLMLFYLIKINYCDKKAQKWIK